MHIPTLYGMSVNYSGNCLCDEAFVSYAAFNLILNVDFCERMTISDLYFQVNFCEHNVHTIPPTSVGLAVLHYIINAIGLCNILNFCDTAISFLDTINAVIYFYVFIKFINIYGIFVNI